jgi:type IV secretory pathway ATPase VirB11/archaellum biosynthesis ATPase
MICMNNFFLIVGNTSAVKITLLEQHTDMIAATWRMTIDDDSGMISSSGCMLQMLTFPSTSSLSCFELTGRWRC